MKSIKESAWEFLEDACYTSLPIDPFKLAKTYDIECKQEKINGFDGCLLSEKEGTLILINSKVADNNRKNFTCAHELGHFYFDLSEVSKSKTIFCKPEVINYLLPQNKISSPRWNSIELRANKFASEILMPSKLLEPLIKNKEPSWELFSELQNQCNVSLAASLTKFIELTNYSCWYVEVRDGMIQRYSKSNINPLEIYCKTKINLKDASNWQPCSPFQFFYETDIPKPAKRKEIYYISQSIRNSVKYFIVCDLDGILIEDDYDY